MNIEYNEFPLKFYEIVVTFYWFIALLLGLSSGLLLYLILRKPKAIDDYREQRIQRYIALYHQRLLTLDDELDKQYITEQEHQALVADQARTLIIQVNRCASTRLRPPRRKAFLWLLIPVPVLAVFLYAKLGAYADWEIGQNIQQLNQTSSEQDYQQQLTQIYTLVEQRLQQRPDQIEYRVMLARAAMSKQDYAQATSHYAILVELLPEDADALAFYAQALYLADNRQMSARAALYLEKALNQNPLQSTALGLLGVIAFEQDDLPAAIDAWQKLLQVLPAQSQQALMIQQAVNEAEQRLLIEQNEADNRIKPNIAEAELGIEIQLSMSDALAHLSPDTLVFVYAKAASGPAVPLAVQKLRLQDLPLQLTLTESMAMMPQMSLSNFAEIIVGARVSLSAKPIAGPGDWQVESSAFNWQKNTQAVRLRIEKQLP